MTQISLANGLNLGVDQSVKEVTEAIEKGKVGAELFVHFTGKGKPLALAKPALEIVLSVFEIPDKGDQIERAPENVTDRDFMRRLRA